jgi:alpha-amylase/alpha-mannosidase (GH57 family)
MADIDLVFIWHMHQPYYGDPVSNFYSMPWVRLHGVKGYYDMPLMLKEFPEIGFTINLTPSLIRQLREYAEQDIYDEYFELSTKPAAELTLSEKIFVLRNFFLCRKETMIQPHPAYQRLFAKRGTRPGVDLERACRDFSSQEFLDLQVWFNLTWFGFKALKEYPELMDLRKKGSRFTEQEKLRVLEIHREILQKLIPLYRNLWSEGRLEVSTTPFYHPILPLLCDTEIAREASAKIDLPSRFSWPQDASSQVKNGLDYMDQTFGRRPVGMWPSENAVSDQALRIMAENGMKWANTDEQQLKKTRPGKNRAELVYHPYRFQDTALNVVFRDQEISDIISFNYSQLESGVAVADFLRRIDAIKKQLDIMGKPRGLVVIALDGENPWESFPESGNEFLNLLFDKLAREQGVKVQNMGQALENYEPEPLYHLAPGTWIQGNFEIWIGDPEKNQAWDYLGIVRKDAEEYFQSASGPQLEMARNELFAAEGSDWFWWYGDDFYSEIDTEFDNIFRTHLKNVYLALGRKPPLLLEEPVKFDHPVRLAAKPTGFISPIIDGRESSFYEWQEAGSFDVLKVLHGYYSQEPHFSKIFFGFDSLHLYLRLDPHRPEDIRDDLMVEIRFEKPALVQIQFPYQLEKEAHQKFKVIVCRGKEECLFENDSIRKHKIFELAVPFADLGFSAGQQAWFRVYVYKGERQMARYPRDGLISFINPDRDFETRMWNV